MVKPSKPDVPFSERRYILVARDGAYVKNVTGTDLQTVKVKFHFTNDRAQAKEYSFNDILSPQAVEPIGTEFVRGFAGRLERVH